MKKSKFVVAHCFAPDGSRLDIWFARGSHECALEPQRLRMLEEKGLLEWLVNGDDQAKILAGNYTAPN